MRQAIAAASKLVPAGYGSAAKLQVLTQEEMKKIGIEDEEIRKGLALLTDPPKGKKGKARRSKDHDLDKPLPTKEVKETVDTDLDFDEIHAEEVSPISALAWRSGALLMLPFSTGPHQEVRDHQPRSCDASMGHDRRRTTRLSQAGGSLHRFVLFLSLPLSSINR